MTTAADHPPVRRAGRSRVKEAVCLLVIAASGLAAVFAWHNRRAYHLATVQEGVLYRDGARSTAQFASALDTVHPRTVVSLVDQAEESDPAKPQFAQEAKLCAQRGIKLERIEVKLGGWPTTDDVRRFLNTATEKQNQPVLVHCAQGVRRTAMFVAAYQESVLGFDKARAKDAILTFGHSERTIDDIKRFIDEYDPRTQTVSDHLADAK